MAGEKYADKAVAKLLAWYEAQLQTYLTATETAQSLAAGSLTAPVDYVAGQFQEDTRTPLLLVSCDSGDTEDWNAGVYSYDCAVSLMYSSDANIEAGQLFMRRYMTALIDTVRADHTLGGTVAQALEMDQSLFSEKSADAVTRHAIALGIEIKLHEP